MVGTYLGLIGPGVGLHSSVRHCDSYICRYLWMMRKALVAAMRLEGRLEDTLKNKREEGRCGV